TASGLIIALSQLKHLLGIQASGDTLPELLESIAHSIDAFNAATFLIGGGSLLFLYWARTGLKRLLGRTSLSPFAVNLCVRSAPVLSVLVTAALACGLRLDTQGVALMGSIPAGLPQLQLPAPDLDVARMLLV